MIKYLETIIEIEINIQEEIKIILTSGSVCCILTSGSACCLLV
jgi:hypothetical protein